MKEAKLLFILIVIIVSAGVFTVVNPISKPGEKDENTPVLEIVKNNTFSSQLNSEGNTTVKVMPENVSSDKKSWSFKIVLDAHEGSLDQDLTKNVYLIDDQKSKSNPLKWEGDSIGGHHREGLLTFESFLQTPKLVTLIIENIGIPERKFTWSIN